MSEVKSLQEEKKEKKEREQALIRSLMLQVLDPKYKPKYRPDFCAILLEHMGVKGQSYQSLAFKLGIASRDTLYKWEKMHPEWKMCKEIAQSGRIGYVEEMLQNLANGTFKGNAAAAIFYAKNACPDQFKDKREMEVTGGVTWVIDTGIPVRQLPEGVVNKMIESELDIEDIEYKESEEDDSDLL